MKPSRAVSFVVGLASAIASPVARAYEEQSYELVRSFDAFELRRYGPALVAETEATGDREEAGDAAFRLLFDYIRGDNQPAQKIAMTVPARQDLAPVRGEKVTMTTPVLEGSPGATGSWVFTFVVPSHYTRDTVPLPLDPRVRIREVPSRLMAVRRFSWRPSEARFRENEATLLAALAAAGLEPIATPVAAYYDAPFTPWFLRRNEVMVEVRER